MFPIGDENERGHGPAVVTLAIIALNVLVFIFLQGGGGPEGDDFTYGYSAVPYEITNGVDLTEPQPIDVGGQQVAVPQEPGPSPIWLTLFSSIFMHGGWLHLGGNMLFLWIFGNNVEDRMGRIRYLLFYLFTGYVATYGFALFNQSSQQPLIGASGAIAGVLGAYIVLYPRARVWSLVPFLLFIPLRLPAWLVLGGWFLLQWFYTARVQVSTGGDSVAYLAHVLGFLAGMLLALPLRGRRPAVAPPGSPYRF